VTAYRPAESMATGTYYWSQTPYQSAPHVLPPDLFARLEGGAPPAVVALYPAGPVAARHYPTRAAAVAALAGLAAR
jgi:hypothetical protein